jgi:hypothetical protein
MNPLLIFFWVYGAMVAMAFWEAYAEGRNAWVKGKVGWRVSVGGYVVVSGYHFFLVWVMLPMLVFLPLVIHGWDTRLFGVLLSAYVSGLVVEDFMWYVVNPVVKLREFNPTWADHYPWVGIGRVRLPLYYILGALIAAASWWFLWR